MYSMKKLKTIFNEEIIIDKRINDKKLKKKN